MADVSIQGLWLSVCNCRCWKSEARDSTTKQCYYGLVNGRSDVAMVQCKNNPMEKRSGIVSEPMPRCSYLELEVLSPCEFVVGPPVSKCCCTCLAVLLYLFTVLMYPPGHVVVPVPHGCARLYMMHPFLYTVL